VSEGGCRGWESNPHDSFESQDFKSCASASFATPAHRQCTSVASRALAAVSSQSRNNLLATNYDRGLLVYGCVMGEVLVMVGVQEEAADPADAESRLLGLFESHHRRLYVLARRLTASPTEAEDVVQDTFLRVARSSAPVPRASSEAEAWLVRILVNVPRPVACSGRPAAPRSAIRDAELDGCRQRHRGGAHCANDDLERAPKTGATPACSDRPS
jgi:hypothetical protein